MDRRCTCRHSWPQQMARLNPYQRSRWLQTHGAGKLFHPILSDTKIFPIKSPPFVTGSLCLPSPYKQLTQLTFGPQGGFVMKFEQLHSTVPVELPSGEGTISGFWVTLDARYIFQHQTVVVWSVYGCSRGHPQSM